MMRIVRIELHCTLPPAKSSPLEDSPGPVPDCSVTKLSFRVCSCEILFLQSLSRARKIRRFSQLCFPKPSRPTEPIKKEADPACLRMVAPEMKKKREERERVEESSEKQKKDAKPITSNNN